MRVWHDDVRRPPDPSWEWARTNDEAIMFLQTGAVEEISLDHDMGMDHVDPDAPGSVLLRGASEDDGFALVSWMCDTGLIPGSVTIHSWNPAGAKRMAAKLNDHGCRAVIQPFSL